MLDRTDQLTMAHICAGIDSALAAPPFAAPPLQSTEATRRVFLRTWALASQLRHREASIDHMLAALATGDEGEEEWFALLAGGDRTALLAGALIRLSCLGTVVGETSTHAIRASEDVLRWLNEAARLAARRGAGGDALRPADLVEVLNLRDEEGDRSIRSRVKRMLKTATRTGRTRAELEKARQGIETLGKSVSFYRSQTNQRLRDVTGGLQSLSERMDGMAPPAPHAAVPSVSLPDERITSMAGDLADARRHLSSLDERAGRIESRLPRSPAPLLLALAIVGVIGIGAAAGLALAHTSDLAGIGLGPQVPPR